MDAEIERARALLEGAHEILLVSPERPDGDAVGSLLGLTLSLRRRGQSATAVLGAPLPARYGFLPGASEVRPTIPAETDLLVAVDCAELSRTGIPAGELRRPAGVHIDPPPTNTRSAPVTLG